MPRPAVPQTARHRPTWVDVDLAAIRTNVERLSPAAPTRVMAVVKANAYGHGSIEVATAAVQAGATWLGVALVEEGIELREAGLRSRILVLSELPPGSEEAALNADLTPTVYSQEGLRRLVTPSRGTVLSDRVPRVHVKVNTGMNRVGSKPTEIVSLVQDAVRAGLVVEGLWTHFAQAEIRGDAYTQLQIDSLKAVRASLTSMGHDPAIVHAANTAGTLEWPDAQLDLVRLGIGLYGISPAPQGSDRGLSSAMTWKSRVSFAKSLTAGESVSYGLTYRLSSDATVATVPVGYADGYPRLLSNRAVVLIRGRRYPVVGRVTMDQIMVDCGTDNVAAGDEVVLLGRQDAQTITAWDLARWADTIPNEVVCSIGTRVPRIYHDSRQGLAFPGRGPRRASTAPGTSDRPR